MEYDTLIAKLIEKNLLTLQEGKVCVKPIDKYSFVTFPLEENDYIQLTQEEYLGLLTRIYMFNDDLDGVVDFEEPTQTQQGE